MIDFSDTTKWWVLDTGWTIAMNGKHVGYCRNRITKEECSFVQLLQKTHGFDKETAKRSVLESLQEFGVKKEMAEGIVSKLLRDI